MIILNKIDLSILSLNNHKKIPETWNVYMFFILFVGNLM